MHHNNINLPAGSATQSLTTGAGRIKSYNFRETTGAAVASFRITDGNAPGADILVTQGLTAGASEDVYLGKHGRKFEAGLFFTLLAGSVEGVITMVTEDQYNNHADRVIVLQLPAVVTP